MNERTTSDMQMTQTGAEALAEIQLRRQLRMARRIVEDELGGMHETAVVAVFEQLCFRGYDGQIASAH